MRLSTKNRKNTQNTQLELNYLEVLNTDHSLLIWIGFIFAVRINRMKIFILTNCETWCQIRDVKRLFLPAPSSGLKAAASSGNGAWNCVSRDCPYCCAVRCFLNMLKWMFCWSFSETGSWSRPVSSVAVYTLLKDLTFVSAEIEIAGTISLFDNIYIITMEVVTAKQKKLLLYKGHHNIQFTPLSVDKRQPEITCWKHY